VQQVLDHMMAPIIYRLIFGAGVEPALAEQLADELFVWQALSANNPEETKEAAEPALPGRKPRPLQGEKGLHAVSPDRGVPN
jgi:hypothetical protein